jgi:transposase
MSFSKIIGIDVSKLTLDVKVLPDLQVCQVQNDPKGIKQLFRWLGKECKVQRSEALFAFEHTGFYSYNLAVMLQKREFAFVMLPGLEIKRSLGISRGKDDKIDAGKIAEYADLRRHKITPTQLPEKEIEEMKRLLSLRDRLVRDRAGFMSTLSEAKRAMDKKDAKTYFQIQESMIKELTLHIERLDIELSDLVENNPELKKQFDLIVSIKGVGPQTALNMIAVTHAFRKFPNWRKFACYAGTAPFPYASGTSIRGKTKVSPLANKKIKSLLGNAAASAIQHNTEMRLYYQRRTQAGKNVMATQNIIRNKLLARIFAVVERGKPYVEIMKYAA